MRALRPGRTPATGTRRDPLGAALLVLIAALALAAPAQAEVIGKDGRVNVPPRLSEIARGVGLLYNAPAEFACTAFCLAPDIIATSAHCLLRKRGHNGPVKLADFRFSPDGPFSSGAVDRLDLKLVSDEQPRLSFLAGASRGGAAISQQAQDFAIARLSAPSCEGRALELAQPTRKQIARAAQENSLFMIGYHGDRLLIEKWYSPDCAVRSRNSRYFLASQRREMRRAPFLLAHTCDMSEGASGAPIFMQTAQGPRVIAINSGSVGHVEYRQGANGKQRVIARRSTNLAVLVSAFAASLPRFIAEHLLADEAEFRALQRALKARGLYTRAIDGIYGRGTRSAILAREKEQGLAPLGLPTRELLEGLRGHARGISDHRGRYRGGHGKRAFPLIHPPSLTRLRARLAAPRRNREHPSCANPRTKREAGHGLPLLSCARLRAGAAQRAAATARLAMTETRLARYSASPCRSESISSGSVAMPASASALQLPASACSICECRKTPSLPAPVTATRTEPSASCAAKTPHIA